MAVQKTENKIKKSQHKNERLNEKENYTSQREKFCCHLFISLKSAMLLFEVCAGLVVAVLVCTDHDT